MAQGWPALLSALYAAWRAVALAGYRLQRRGCCGPAGPSGPAARLRIRSRVPEGPVLVADRRAGPGVEVPAPAPGQAVELPARAAGDRGVGATKLAHPLLGPLAGEAVVAPLHQGRHRTPAPWGASRLAARRPLLRPN